MSIGSRHVSSDPASRHYGQLRRVPLVDALLETYDTDAHAYLYVDPDARETSRHSDAHPHPRLDALRVDTLIADVDNPGHARHASDAAAIAGAEQLLQLAQTAAVYVTGGGFRIVQPLTRALGYLEADAAMRAWYAELDRRGIAVDHATSQWTRCFRLPHVRRDREHYRSPLVDYARMRPIPPPAGGLVARARTRGGPLVDVAELADLPDRWRELAARLHPVVLAEPWGVADGWHRLALRLAGAALQRGLRPEHAAAFVLASFPAQMPRAQAARAAHDTARRYASRRPIQGTRALRDAHPRVADVLDPLPARPPAPELPSADDASAALLEDLRVERPGLRLIAAGCGLGKTRAARVVAAERAARGERTCISVPTHELALQVTADLRAAGVDVRRLFGPLSVRAADGSPACHWHVQASRLAEGRQSVRAMLCDTCEHSSGCAARELEDGPRSAPVVVGPHALLRSLVAAAGAKGLLILDEPPPVTEQATLQAEHLAEVETYADRFDPCYMDRVRPAIALVAWWLRLAGLDVADWGRPGHVYHLTAALDLTDPESAAAARSSLAEASAGLEAPALLPSAARRTKADPGLATTLGRVSRTLDVVRRALLSQEARARVEAVRGDETRRTLALTILREDLALALRRDGPTVVAAADVDLHAAGYERVAGTVLPRSAYAARDGAPIDRTQLALRATRTHWLPLPSELEGHAYQALQLALVWLREQPWRRAGLVTYLELERRLRGAWAELVPPGLEVRHYGALRGLDSWSDLDAIVTLGDPYPPADHVERDLLLLDLPAGSEQVHDLARAMAAAELEQAHGRIRAPHRTRPARALHVGQVVPAGWHTHRTLAGPAEAVATPDEVRRLVERRGGVRAVATLTGAHPSAVSRWMSGERRCPAHMVVWLRTCSVDGPGRPEGEAGDGAC